MVCVLNAFWLVPLVYTTVYVLYQKVLCIVLSGPVPHHRLIFVTCVYELMGGDVWIMFNSILHILSNSVFGNTQAENDSWMLVLYLAIV